MCGPHCSVLAPGAPSLDVSTLRAAHICWGHLRAALYEFLWRTVSDGPGHLPSVPPQDSGGLLVCRSLPDPDNTPTASWPCWGPSASPEDSWAPQGPRPGYPFQALSERQRPLSLLPWNFPCRPCQRLQEYIKKKMFPVRAGLFYGSRGWEADRRVERPCHDVVPSAEQLGPCLPPGPSLEALVPSQAKPPFTPVPHTEKTFPSKAEAQGTAGSS